MKVILKDPELGLLYRCDCGTKIYSRYGQAKKHRESCPRAK